MPAKRIKPKARAHRVTPEAKAAFEAGDWRLLHTHLGLKPWEASPLDIESEADADCHGNGAWKLSVPKALQLRIQLFDALGAKPDISEMAVRPFVTKWP